MVNYYIYAKDFSGSTRGSRHYHSNGMKTLDQFKSEVEKIQNKLLAAKEPPKESKIIYIHWGDKCYEVDEDTVLGTYIRLEGNMGTEPETIIQWIQKNGICDENNKIKLLYLITDGLIHHRSIEKCFDLNESMNYETVVFHAFNENVEQIDLSVAATFLKGRCLVYRNYQLLDNTDISEEFEYDKININNFEAEKDNLKSYIRLKFIKTFKHDAVALQEIDKLKKLRNRLFLELSSMTQKTKVNLETRDRNVFLHEFVKTDWYKNLITPEHKLKVEIEKCASTLINYIVAEKKSFSFDALKFDTKYDNDVDEEPIVDVNFTAEQEIDFPDIILDEEKGIPVIILMEFNLLDKIIFHKTKEPVEVTPASFNKFRSAMECPLFLLNDPDISESIGYFYTFNVYKQLLESNTKTEPRTRRPFHGGIVLTDTDTFDKYNDYIISATYFDSKKINLNVGLFYFILLKNCENKQWMDKNVVDQFKKYVILRISNSVCIIGLSSLPLDPQINTSLPTALWYCVELSSCIFKDNPQHFMHERLRMFYGVAHGMIEILKYYNYDLDTESIEKRIDLIRHVMTLKRIPTHREKVYYLVKDIFKNVHSFLVSEIEKPFNLKRLNYLKLNHQGMLSDNVIKETVHLNDYVHLMDCVGNGSKSYHDSNEKICEKTFRPFFTISKNKSFYTELFKATKKVVINNDHDEDKINITFEPIDSLRFDKILSLYNLFINYVKDNEKYPTFSEYIGYILKKKRFKDDLVTIFPSNTYFNAEVVYSRYQDIMTKVDVSKFNEVCKNYVKRSERVKVEGVAKNDDCEITKFICDEESKVCLKNNNISIQRAAFDIP